MKDALAQAYLEKFRVRVEVLPEYQKRGAYSEVIREGQEALELFIKAQLRLVGVDPSHSHDPGKELIGLEAKLPKALQALATDIISWSKKLRKERELSFYGAFDFIPTEEYSKDEGQEVIDFLSKLNSKI